MQDNSKLPVSKFAAILAETQRKSGGFATTGYVTDWDDDVMRVYFDLNLDTYAEIPTGAVVHAEYAEDDKLGRANLVVAGDAPITLVQTQRTQVSPAAMNLMNAYEQAVDDQKDASLIQAMRPGGSMTQCSPDPCSCGGHAQGGKTIGEVDARPSRSARRRDRLRSAARWFGGPIGRLI